MLRKGLNSEFGWFAIYFIAMLFIGMSFGYGREAAIFALLLYVAWLYRNIRSLEAWVRRTRDGKPHTNNLVGIWGEIAEDVKLLTKRYQKDKLRLQTVVSRVQEMTSALNDGVILADKRANIEWWNQAAGEMLDLREIDLGQRITNILRDPSFQHYFDAQEYAEPLEMESYRNDGRQFLYQVHPFGQGERLIVVRDITRVAKLEQMRRDFVANVSHELRTPLTVIRGYVETLLDMPGQPPMQHKALDQVRLQGERMSALVNDLITLTKLETDERSAQRDYVNVHSLVDQVFADAYALSDTEFVFNNEVPDDITLRGSEKELRSVVSNLVINAVKYAPGTHQKACNIRVYSTIHAGLFSLIVEDDGIGIDPKHLPRLTERFYRVDQGRSSTAGGTGLGLAIVKHALLRHDAILNITSQPRKFTKFECGFPTQRLIHSVQQA